MRGRSLALLLFAGLALLAAFYLMNRRGAEDEVPSAEAPVPTRTERPAKGGIPDDRLARVRAGKPLTERQKILANLKERWAELKPKGNSAIKEQDALGKESAELLLCSEEAITLMAWLVSKEQRYGELRMRIELTRLLKSEDSGALREMLTELPSNPPDSGKEGFYLINRLCNAAGQGCPAAEFEAFALALQDDAYAQEATLGRNLVLMRSDPKAGILSTLEIFKGDVHSISKWDHLNRQMREDFPEGVDFAELELLLPEPGSYEMKWVTGRDPIDSGRRNLMGKWAKTDLDAAATHVMENPDRLDVELMRTVVGAAKFGSPEEAVAWVEGVEEGPYFDQAVMGSLRYLHLFKQSEAIALAKRIGDAELREEGLKIAERQRVFHEEGG